LFQILRINQSLLSGYEKSSQSLRLTALFVVILSCKIAILLIEA